MTVPFVYAKTPRQPPPGKVRFEFDFIARSCVKPAVCSLSEAKNQSKRAVRPSEDALKAGKLSVFPPEVRAPRGPPPGGGAGPLTLTVALPMIPFPLSMTVSVWSPRAKKTAPKLCVLLSADENV